MSTKSPSRFLASRAFLSLILGANQLWLAGWFLFTGNWSWRVDHDVWSSGVSLVVIPLIVVFAACGLICIRNGVKRLRLQDYS